MAEKGRTAIPTRRSATAKETINKLVTLLSLEEQKTAAMTRQLPTMTSTLMNTRTSNVATKAGSPHLTLSRRAAQAVSFKLLCIMTSITLLHTYTLNNGHPITRLHYIILYYVILHILYTLSKCIYVFKHQFFPICYILGINNLIDAW